MGARNCTGAGRLRGPSPHPIGSGQQTQGIHPGSGACLAVGFVVPAGVNIPGIPTIIFVWLHWWAYATLAAVAGFWWVAWFVPLVLPYLFFRVTGIPPTEAQALASRGEDYRSYQRPTSVFVPWFPGKKR